MNVNELKALVGVGALLFLALNVRVRLPGPVVITQPEKEIGGHDASGEGAELAP